MVLTETWPAPADVAFALIPDALNGGHKNRGRRRDAGLLHGDIEALFRIEVRLEVDFTVREGKTEVKLIPACTRKE
jgi:hypothetical protein